MGFSDLMPDVDVKLAKGHVGAVSRRGRLCRITPDEWSVVERCAGEWLAVI